VFVRSTSQVAQDDEYKSGVTGRLSGIGCDGFGKKNRLASGLERRMSKMEFHRDTSL